MRCSRHWIGSEALPALRWHGLLAVDAAAHAVDVQGVRQVQGERVGGDVSDTARETVSAVRRAGCEGVDQVTKGTTTASMAGTTVKADQVVRVPERARGGRGLWFDFRNDAGKAEVLKREGWQLVLAKYAWPHLQRGDKLVIRFPGTRTGPGELARWGDVWVNTATLVEMQDAAKVAKAAGVELCLYVRRPGKEDREDGGAGAARALSRVVETLLCVRDVTWIIDGAYEEGVPLDSACPWGAALIDLFALLGGKVVVEPAWPTVTFANSMWGRGYPCLVMDEYYARMQREGWAKWRLWDQSEPTPLPEILRVQPGLAAGIDRAGIVAALAAFLKDCGEKKHTGLVYGDLFTDHGISWKDVE